MRIALIALVAVGAIGLGGCYGSGLPGTCADARDGVRPIPSDLPPNPDPTKKYCKVWVPAKMRKVPKLVQTSCSCTERETVTVMETTAREVLVRPKTGKCHKTCGNDCEESLVQVKPGGYRWEHDGTCWQYKYRCPEYQWCKRRVKEEGVEYCSENPAKYKTVVETRPVQKVREKYVPPKYEIRYVNEVYEPGHYEWRASTRCGCSPDRRQPTSRSMGKVCLPKLPKPAPLDCGCPRTN